MSQRARLGSLEQILSEPTEAAPTWRQTIGLFV